MQNNRKVVSSILTILQASGLPDKEIPRVLGKARSDWRLIAKATQLLFQLDQIPDALILIARERIDDADKLAFELDELDELEPIFEDPPEGEETPVTRYRG